MVSITVLVERVMEPLYGGATDVYVNAGFMARSAAEFIVNRYE
jgi:hypothetical protein